VLVDLMLFGPLLAAGQSDGDYPGFVVRAKHLRVVELDGQAADVPSLAAVS